MAWVLIEKGLYTLLQFITIVILGRLLSIEDYGIYGTMIVFIAVSEILIDSGFGGAIIQKKDVSQEDINTLFSINLIISILLYIIIFISAPLIEAIYGIEHLSLYFRIVGLVIIFFALSVVQNSLLIREMKFKKSAIINLSACILSTGCAVVLAYNNWGVWALIIQTVLNSMLMTVFLWASNRIRIELKINKESLHSLWSFGSNLLFSNILTTFVNNVSSNIIPKIGTLKQSGLYLQAYKLSSIPGNILTLTIDKSTFPVLSKEKSTKELITKARDISKTILSVFTPIFPLMSLYSFAIITIVLGEKWGNASTYFQVLSWGGFALMLQSLSRNIMKSYGDSKTIFKVEIVKTFITLTTILISIRMGILFLVYGITVSYFLGAIIWMFVLDFKLGYKCIDYANDIMRPALISIVLYICFMLSGIDFFSYQSLIYLPVFLFLYAILEIFAKDEAMIRIMSKI